jgi:hypothetical protein
MELLDYLDRHLLSEARLLDATRLAPAALQELQRRRLVPLPSYRLRLHVHCTSFFGPHDEEGTLHYYGRGTPAWIDLVRGLDGEHAARALFARRLLARLHALDPAAVMDADREWSHFLDGTYGLCTASGLPEDIAAKEWAAGEIERQLKHGVAAGLDAAVKLLEEASSLFAPHERARSSRYRLLAQVAGTEPEPAQGSGSVPPSATG